MNFDSEMGLKQSNKLNYSMEPLLNNPWATFTKKGISFGRE